MNDKVLQYIDAHREQYVQRLQELLAIPSVSTDPNRKDSLRAAGEWVRSLLANCGIEAALVETDGHPCVMGQAGPSDGPSALIYGHFDVQPEGDESLWRSAPFEPNIRDGEIYARGAADDKGQVLAHLFAVEAWMKTVGSLPLRVKFLIEGEEEIGSPSLEKVVRSHREDLACDYVVLSDTPKFDKDTPAITISTKGMIYKEIILRGPKQNLHSGHYGGTLTNPGNALGQIIASFHDQDRRVAIPGFYDDVRALSGEERQRMTGLPFDEGAYLSATGAPLLTGEAGYSTLERRWARPTLDINGLLSGFTGDGSSTIIPATAMAKVSMRLVPDQDPVKVSRGFDGAVRRAAPGGVQIEIKDHALCAPYVSNTDSPGMRAAEEAMEAGWGKVPFLVREGGSLPILPMFKEVLGADSLMMGFCAPDCNAHGPNEFFGLEDLHRGIRTAAHFCHALSRNGGS